MLKIWQIKSLDVVFLTFSNVFGAGPGNTEFDGGDGVKDVKLDHSLCVHNTFSSI
jgi:hypothetical protein